MSSAAPPPRRCNVAGQLQSWLPRRNPGAARSAQDRADQCAWLQAIARDVDPGGGCHLAPRRRKPAAECPGASPCRAQEIRPKGSAMSLDDPPRALALVVVLSVLLALLGAVVVLAALQPPPPPPPRTDIVGLVRAIGSTLSPSSAPSLAPAPSSTAAPSAFAAPPPSAAANAAPSAASRPLHRAPQSGTSGRKPGTSDTVDPWGSRD
jgi:hypothetical protein